MSTTQREQIFFCGSSVVERGKTHHGKSNLFQETPKPLCSTFLPTDVKHCLNVGYTFVNFATSEAVWKSHVCITRKSWPLFKSKKFEDIQAMYEKIKRSDEDFIAIGSVEDDRLITKMNKRDSSKGEEINAESKEESGRG
ncbi:protein terminal ear1 [Tanacetum coccineum]